jgi:hypothetical protein
LIVKMDQPEGNRSLEAFMKAEFDSYNGDIAKICEAYNASSSSENGAAASKPVIKYNRGIECSKSLFDAFESL